MRVWEGGRHERGGSGGAGWGSLRPANGEDGGSEEEGQPTGEEGNGDVGRERNMALVYLKETKKGACCGMVFSRGSLKAGAKVRRRGAFEDLLPPLNVFLHPAMASSLARQSHLPHLIRLCLALTDPPLQFRCSAAIACNSLHTAFSRGQDVHFGCGRVNSLPVAPSRSPRPDTTNGTRSFRDTATRNGR